MSFSVARPQALYLLLLAIPFLLFYVLRYRKIIRALGQQRDASREGGGALRRTRRCFFWRTVLRALSWCALVAAYAGISWGVSSVPVQRSGRAVAFVFDISHSMEARDCADGLSRLEAASAYAQGLLARMPSCTVSVVLAKGEGTVAVPQTEDRESVIALTENLSPRLMTAKGSSIGRGIEEAVLSFPAQSAQAPYVWVFTDGEETDDTLVPALTAALRSGISVAIVGFGSEEGSTVLAGDGSTEVQSALRGDAVQEAIAAARRRSLQSKGSRLGADVTYVPAAEEGSAWRLLDMLRPRSPLVPGRAGADADTFVVYELEGVERHGLFVLVAIACLALSFLAGELSPFRPGKTSARGRTALAVLAGTLCLSGCTERFADGARLLAGRLEWNQKNYQDAVADFLSVQDSAVHRSDADTEQYALFALAATYLMQNETESAQKRFDELSADVPPAIRFAVLYNQGIIAHRGGDFARAAECFKEALRVDGTSVSAKINLELSLKEGAAHARQEELGLLPVSENTDELSAMETAMYAIIRENEQKQWKNQQQDSESSALDY